jgi:hypothetical protein
MSSNTGDRAERHRARLDADTDYDHLFVPGAETADFTLARQLEGGQSHCSAWFAGVNR